MIISIAPPVSKTNLKECINWVERNDLDWKILTDKDTKIKGGLLLCGGADVGTRPKRDKFEKKLVDQALENNLPIIGICRGMQLVNSHLGGVVENVWNEGMHAIDDTFGGENVQRKRSVFHRVNSKKNNLHFDVNSRHHQHCSILADCLMPQLWAGDGTIECAVGKRIVLVQWHPERKEMWDNWKGSSWPIFRISRHLKK